MNASISAFASVAVAIRSRSRKVSRRRRTEPASETRSAAGWARSSSATASTAGSPCPSSGRAGALGFVRSFSALRMFSSTFGPRPVSVRSRSCSAAARSSATVVIPSSCQIRRAVFGPRPGRCMNAITSGGIRSRRLATASISPVSTIWTIFSSIVLPIPWSSFALPSSASWAIDPPVSLIRCAARR